MEVLWHLKEVDRRKMYSDHKCGSLFEYSCKVLKYSEGQASRRVSACRLLRELPELARPIEKGEINLTQLNQVKQFFADENVELKDEKLKIIDQIKGKTTRESERILWSLKEVDTPRRVHVFLKENTLELLKAVQALKAHQFFDLDQTIHAMSELAIETWTPKSKRRMSKPSPGKSRYISVSVKEAVWKMSKGKCQNCGSTYALQIDHKKSFSKGGPGILENLQLLCRNCNQRKAKMEFGHLKGPPKWALH
jgi:5-methylcytosine-specific restriction endonuclease McrA